MQFRYADMPHTCEASGCEYISYREADMHFYESRVFCKWHWQEFYEDKLWTCYACEEIKNQILHPVFELAGCPICETCKEDFEENQ